MKDLEKILGIKIPTKTSLPNKLEFSLVPFVDETPPNPNRTPTTETAPQNSDMSMQFSESLPTMSASDKMMRQMLFQKLQERMPKAEQNVEELGKMYQDYSKRMPNREQYFSAASYLDAGGLSPNEIATTLAPIVPENDLQRQEMLRKLLEEQVTGEQAFQNNLSSTMRGLDSDLALQRLAMSQGRRNEDVQMKAFDKISENMEKPQQTYSDEQLRLSAMLQALKEGKAKDIQSAVTQLVKAAGETGVLTDADVERYLPTSALIDIRKAQAYITGDFKGKMPQEAIAVLSRTADAIGKASAAKLYDKLTAYETKLKKGPAAYQIQGLPLIADAKEALYEKYPKEELDRLVKLRANTGNNKAGSETKKKITREELMKLKGVQP